MKDVILDTVNLGILVLNEHLKFIYANKYMFDYFKLQSLKATDNDVFDRDLFLAYIHPEDREVEADKCNKLLSDKESSTSVCRIKIFGTDSYKWIKV